MAVLTTPCPARFHKPPQAFPDRLALDDPVSLACFAPIVGKSEKVKCTRAPCRLVVAWRPLERNQRRFLRMNGEAETGEAFRQDFHNPAGIGFALTADDKIIGKATQKTAALHPGVDVLDNPFVQDMMQEYIGEHGRTHSPYKVANFFFRGWTPQGVDRSERRHAPRWGPPPPASPGHGSVRVCVPSLPP